METRTHKHAIIVAHPSEDSFTMSVAGAYRTSVESLGHEVIVRDLYRMAFEPRLLNSEIPRPGGFSPAPDIIAERAAIAEARTFCFVYPVWFYAPPAIVVGYIQRVFGMGFGYGGQRGGENQRLLIGRSLITFTSSGSPAEWMHKDGGGQAMRNIFDEHVAEVCGLTVIEHRHYGRVLNATPKTQIDAHLRDVRATVERCFAPHGQA